MCRNCGEAPSANGIGGVVHTCHTTEDKWRALHGPRLAPEHVATLRSLSECYGEYRLGPTSREAIRAVLAALGEKE